MNIDEKIQKVLSAIRNEKFNPKTILPDEPREEIKRVLDISEDEGFLSHKSTKQSLVMLMGSNGYMLHPSTYITRSGEQFLEGYDRTNSKPFTTYNINNVSHSALGEHNTVNNYSQQPIKDLEDFIKELDDENKQQGEDLICVLKNEEIKPGYLSKFESFLSKYPKIIDFISSFVVSAVISNIR